MNNASRIGQINNVSIIWVPSCVDNPKIWPIYFAEFWYETKQQTDKCNKQQFIYTFCKHEPQKELVSNPFVCR